MKEKDLQKLQEKEVGETKNINNEIEERLRKANEAIERLEQEFEIKIYAANQMQQNGEVIPIVKIVNIKKYV